MRRPFIYFLLFLISLIILTLWWPINDSACDAEAFLSSTTQKFQVQAAKVIVEPWRGKHHVYGVFMVPNEYKESPFFVLTVKGFGNECAKPFGYKQYYDGISAAPGTHLLREYIRTRTALRLILQGLYNQLNDKNNWTLTYPQP
ncbi:hypothetical protein NIES2107_00790 [Nostoc carneum NIES-2107]|nr:hypothetical protein NIES2107_00790 [Nostoc carneum NIES-2107]